MHGLSEAPLSALLLFDAHFFILGQGDVLPSVLASDFMAYKALSAHASMRESTLSCINTHMNTYMRTQIAHIHTQLTCAGIPWLREQCDQGDSGSRT